MWSQIIRWSCEGLLIPDDERLKIWNGYFTTVLNLMTRGELPRLVDKMAGKRNV